ncbi:MAG: sugar ABC transporter permease [Ruminococcus sp.]|nr:sugar ABC transporter permease [Ruminococcus sp.]MDD6646064.1 sugar ABC transporter permease [Oscillospiraceae bacterium]
MKFEKKQVVWAYIFLLPSLIGIAVFYVIPYIMCVYSSFVSKGSFAGLDNYIKLFQNKAFLYALRNTVIFTAVAIPLLMIISFLIAKFLASFKKISAFFRSAYLMPIVIPAASLIYVWQLLFDDYGVVNNLLSSLGIDTVQFFSSGFSMVMIIIIYIWKNCGFCVILFTAGLANLPKSVHESAYLEGAGGFKTTIKITLPLITPTTFFVFLMAVINSFRMFRESFSLFGTYPNENIYFLQNFINNNYNNFNYPQLSSSAIVMSLIFIGLMLIFFLYERKSDYLE